MDPLPNINHLFQLEIQLTDIILPDTKIVVSSVDRQSNQNNDKQTN